MSVAAVTLIGKHLGSGLYYGLSRLLMEDILLSVSSVVDFSVYDCWTSVGSVRFR